LSPILTHLKISRPGLWFPTIWIYLLPLAKTPIFWQEPYFWFGLIFVAFPLNYFVYSLNDLGDVSADRLNNRKGNFLFGAKESKEVLLSAVKASTYAIIILAGIFTYIAGWWMILLFGGIIFINYIYNFKPFRIKNKPPLELFIQTGYILTGVFSVVLNEVSMFPWQTVVYLMFFCFQAHLAGEIMDIDPDKAAGKRTTAVLIGRKRSKYLMIGLLCIEVFILIFWFEDYVLAGSLGIFLFWMLLDVFVIYKDKPYTQAEMRLFGYGMNAIGFGSMLWIICSGKLLL
jgi:4-hydroxybenzoate polyprenyltransferase